MEEWERRDTLHERLVRGLVQQVEGAQRNGARKELRRILMEEEYPHTDEGWLRYIEYHNEDLPEDEQPLTSIGQAKKLACSEVAETVRTNFPKVPDAWVTYDVTHTFEGGLRTIIYLFEVEVTSHLSPHDMQAYQSLWWYMDSTSSTEMVLVTVDKRGYLQPVDVFAYEWRDRPASEVATVAEVMGICSPGYWGKDAHPPLPRRVTPVSPPDRPHAPDPRIQPPVPVPVPEPVWREHLRQRSDSRRGRK